MIKKDGRGALTELQEKLASKAAYEASRPTEPTYKVDETEEVFATIQKEVDETEEEQKPLKKMKPKMNKKKKKIAVPT